MKIKYVMMSLLIMIGLSACNQKLTPMEVTEAFWLAVQEDNVDAMQQLIISDQQEETGEDLLPVSQASFGRMIIDQQQAEVETEIVIESDQDLPVSLDTFLVREEEQWKVDYDKTVASLTKRSEMAKMMQSLKGFGEEISKEIDSSMNELEKAIPEIQREFSRMEESFKEHVPELKKQFEEMRKQLEEAMKEAEPTPETAETQAI